MPVKKTHKIVIRGGKLHFIYDDALKGFLGLGQADVKRASHVEPAIENGVVVWKADLSPVSPGLVLGPFDTRKEALDAEVKYLEANILRKAH